MVLQVETFVLNDRRSIKKLHRNPEGVILSAYGYRAFLVALLKANDGYMTKDEILKDVEKHYSGAWGADDLAKLGKSKMTKWRNQLAWALVVLGKKKEVLWRQTKDDNGKKVVWYVLMSPETKAAYRQWVQEDDRVVKRSFRKNCSFCGSKNLLSRKKCRKCKNVFPKPLKRNHKYPA